MMSAAVPGVNGTTNFTGFVGKESAQAKRANGSVAAVAIIDRRPKDVGLELLEFNGLPLKLKSS